MQTTTQHTKVFGSRLNDIRSFISDMFEDDLYVKRIQSLANATLGVKSGATLAVSLMGQALAQARGLTTKHAVKQVDRLLRHSGIAVWDCFARWVPAVLGAREEALVAMDWTDFDSDKQTTLVWSLVSSHGRATPLIRLSVDKSELKDRRNAYEQRCVSRLAEMWPDGVKVTVLADEGLETGSFMRI